MGIYDYYELKTILLFIVLIFTLFSFWDNINLLRFTAAWYGFGMVLIFYILGRK